MAKIVEIKHKIFSNIHTGDVGHENGDGLTLWGPYDWLGYDDNHNSIYNKKDEDVEYYIHHCIFDNIGVDPKDADEAISCIWGAKVHISYCYIGHWGKALLIGNGDEPLNIAQSSQVKIDHCIFEGCSRRHPYIQGSHVSMDRCLIRNWGETFFDKSFGIRVDREGTLNITNCVFWQDTFFQTGLINFFKDCINQVTSLKNWYHIFTPGVTRGLYKENGGDINAENLYKNKKWISLGGASCELDKNEALSIVHDLYKHIPYPHVNGIDLYYIDSETGRYINTANDGLGIVPSTPSIFK